MWTHCLLRGKWTAKKTWCGFHGRTLERLQLDIELKCIPVGNGNHNVKGSNKRWETQFASMDLETKIKLECDSSASANPVTFVLLMHSLCRKLCKFYATCSRTHVFQIVLLLTHQSTEYFPKSAVGNQGVFMADVRWPSCYSYLAGGFCLASLPWTRPFTDLRDVWSSLDVFLGSAVTSLVSFIFFY